MAVASIFVDRDRATAEILEFVERYVPLGTQRQSFIFDTLDGVVKARGPASLVATLLLCWAVMRFFATLIRAINRAWGAEVRDWWRLPLKSLAFLLAIIAATPLAIGIPALLRAAQRWISPHSDFSEWFNAAGSVIVAIALLFLGLLLFYKLAPRRQTRLSEVWVAALTATALMIAAEVAFRNYLEHFATLNAVYGTFGGIMALLLWIYLSGCIFIFGACLCAAGDTHLEHPELPT